MGKAEKRFRAMRPGEVSIEEGLEIAQALLDEEGDLAPGDFYQFRMTQLKAEDSNKLAGEITKLREEHFKKQGKKPPKFDDDGMAL